MIIHNYVMCQGARNLLSKNVEHYRSKAGLSKEELSLALGFDNSYISKLEKCRINITIDKLELIAKYFNISIDKLFS